MSPGNFDSGYPSKEGISYIKNEVIYVLTPRWEKYFEVHANFDSGNPSNEGISYINKEVIDVLTPR